MSESEAVAAVWTALERGAANTVKLLGQYDGSLGNPKVRIPLPGSLKSAAKLLKVIGQQKRIDALVTAMNRAAKSAALQASWRLINAIKDMSVEDAKRVVTGGGNSVTQFLVRQKNLWASCGSGSLPST